MNKPLRKTVKITRSDSSHLIIVDFPVWMALWFSLGVCMGLALLVSAFHKVPLNLGELTVGGIFVIIGGGAQFALLNRSVFDFDLMGRTVMWKRVGLLGRKDGAFAFDQIKFAYLEYSVGKGINFRPVLQLTDEIVPLRIYSTYDITSRTVCDEMNKALGKSPRTDEEDIAVTVRALIKRGESNEATRIVRKVLHLDSGKAGDYVKSLQLPA